MPTDEERVRMRKELNELNQEIGWLGDERNEIDDRMSEIAGQIQDLQRRLGYTQELADAND